MVVLDCLDHPVRCGGDDGQLAWLGDRLFMVAVDGPLAQWARDRMFTFTPMLIGRCERAWQVLVECAAAMQTHQLHAEADPEHGYLLTIVNVFQERQLESLALGRDRLGQLVCGNSPGFHNRVVAASEDDSVAQGHELLSTFGQAGKENGYTPSLCDGLGALRSGAKAMVAQVECDSDDRLGHGSMAKYRIGVGLNEIVWAAPKKTADRFHDGGGNVGRVPVGDRRKEERRMGCQSPKASLVFSHSVVFGFTVSCHFTQKPSPYRLPAAYSGLIASAGRLS